jgi:hypothetical protein
MPPIPPTISATVRAIYSAYQANARPSYDPWGISVGDADHDCSRALWYTFRWVTPLEVHSGQQLRLFETGNIQESRLVSDLQSIGVEVYDQQDKIRLISGHVRGKCDGKGMGIPEAPRTPHLLEFKSSNEKNMRLLEKKKVKEAKPLHYAQCQLGMHAFGLTRCLYLAVCKDDDRLYSERLEYDFEYCTRLLAKLQRVIDAEEPPPRIADKPDDFRCMFCKHKAVCHEAAMPRVNCRTCIYATPEHGGDAHWSCARFAKPLSIDEQREACPAHLNIPALVPGEQVDCSEEEEWIEYRLASGEIWRDGAHG